MSATGKGPRPRALPAAPGVWLACTSCQLVYQPDVADFTRGSTGCPRCHGWTWIAQLAPVESGSDHADRHSCNDVAPGENGRRSSAPSPAAVVEDRPRHTNITAYEAGRSDEQ